MGIMLIVLSGVKNGNAYLMGGSSRKCGRGIFLMNLVIRKLYLVLLIKIGMDDISDLIQSAGEANFTFIIEHLTEHGLITGDAGERHIGDANSCY